MAWDNDTVGPSLVDDARVGKGRRIHSVDTTHVEVPRETGTYACSGVVQQDDGSRSRGYTLATLRTVLDQAGLITQVGLCPIPVHALPVCRLFFETAPVWRAGDVLWEDRGFVDGATMTLLQQQRPVDVMVPRQSTMLSSQEAVQWAARQEEWPPHPARDHQHIALVKGGEHLWDACQVPLNAWVMRYGNRQKKALDSIVLVTTDQRLHGAWIVRHDAERPEIEQDEAQRQRGGWQLTKLRATRYSAIVLYLLTVVLRSRLDHLFPNTQAGARFADTTRQALAFAQLRTRRTHVIAYAGGYVAIFETLSCARFLLQLPASAQEWLRHWFDAHLRTVTQRE